MIDGATLEAIRRVEQTPLRELVNVSMEDVTTQMDSLLNPELDSSSFYHRWETQQWAVSDLDFSADKVQWANIPPPVQKALRTTMILFFVGEQIVTDTLAPVLHAAPLEDERIFLATQIADEARHTVFFQRFFEEVLGHEGGIHSAMLEFRPKTRAGYRRIFDVELVNAIDACRLEPRDPVAFVDAIVTYHLVIEGFLALGGQRQTLRLLRKIGILPGFVNGFTAVARDESRHIGFGVLALRRRVAENPEMARVIAKKVYDLVPSAVDVVIGPDEKLPFDDISEVPEPMRLNVLEARDFVIDSLSKRLRSSGLSDNVVGEIDHHMRSLYADAWSRYEANHGVEHPVRYWERVTANA
ncbi:MAG: ribonucleotide-diphosphate reductase subunit beta [Candidatus Dormibacteraeota bacterium]|nr:ribonucleotide-diphosphate reductase subunit beta [Candidatus Dormibacteraeota bacterium]